MTFSWFSETEPQAPRNYFPSREKESRIDYALMEWEDLFGPRRTWDDERKLAWNALVGRIKNA